MDDPLIGDGQSGASKEDSGVPGSSQASTLALELIAAAHARGLLLKRIFGAWERRMVEEQASKRRQLVVATLMYANKLTYLFFRAWQWEYQCRVQNREKALKAERFHRLRELRRGFSAWRQFQDSRSRQESECQSLTLKSARRVILLRFQHWLIVLRRKQQSKALQRQAMERILALRFHSWMSFRVRNQLREFNRQVLTYYFSAASTDSRRSSRCMVPPHKRGGRAEFPQCNCSAFLVWRAWMLFAMKRRADRRTWQLKQLRVLEDMNQRLYFNRELKAKFKRWRLTLVASKLLQQTEWRSLRQPRFQHWCSLATWSILSRERMSRALTLELTFHWRRWKERFRSSWHGRIAERHCRTKVVPRQQHQLLRECFNDLRSHAMRSKAARAALSEGAAVHNFFQSLDAMEVLLGIPPAAASSARAERPHILDLVDSPSPRQVVAHSEAAMAVADEGIAEAVLTRLRGLASPIPPRPRGVSVTSVTGGSESLIALQHLSPEQSPPPRSASSMRSADGTQPRDPRSYTVALSASPAPMAVTPYTMHCSIPEHETKNHDYHALLPQCSPAVQHFTLTLQKVLSEYMPLAQQREQEQLELAQLLQQVTGGVARVPDGSPPLSGGMNRERSPCAGKKVSFECPQIAEVETQRGNGEVEARIHWLRERQQRRITLWDQLQLLLSEPDRRLAQLS
jgi:hypothetical protein